MALFLLVHSFIPVQTSVPSGIARRPNVHVTVKQQKYRVSETHRYSRYEATTSFGQLRRLSAYCKSYSVSLIPYLWQFVQVFGTSSAPPRISPTSDYLADVHVDALLISTTELQEDVQEPSDIDVKSRTVGLTFPFPIEQTALDKIYLLT